MQPAPDRSARLRRYRLEVFAVLFIAYVGFYFCRVNFLAAMPGLESEFGFSSTQIGLILSSYFAVYSLAKLVNGFVGLRLAGKPLMLIGIGGSVACNLLFANGTTLSFFLVTWSANAFFQSMGWLALVSVMSQWFASTESGRALGLMSMSYLLGDFLARSSAGLVLGREGGAWTDLFRVHPAVFAAVGVLVALALRPRPEMYDLPPIAPGAAGGAPANPEPGGPPHQAAVAAERPPGRREERRRQLRAMLTHRWFWIACCLYVGLSLIRYIFWSWSIVYLYDSGAGPAGAVFGSAVFPLLGSAGALFAGHVSDRMGARRGPVLAAMCGALVLALGLFSMVSPDWPLGIMVALGLVGFTLTGPYSMLAGAMAVDFGSRTSAATAAGIIDSVGALGAILAGAGMGYLIDTFGWTRAFGVVILVALFCSVLSSMLWSFKPLTAGRAT